MTIKPLVFGLAFLVGGCDIPDAPDDFPDPSSGNVGSSGGPTGAGTGGDGPLVGGAEDQDGGDTTASSGPGGGNDSGTSTGAGTGGQGAGSMRADALDPPPVEVCPDCCADTPIIGEDQISIRVGDSNSFASPLLVEALLPDWNGVSPLPVRRDDFLNLFAPDVPVLDDGAPWAVDAGASPFPSNSGETLLTFQVSVRDLSAVAGSRSIGVLVDTSPSAATSVDSVLGALEGVLVGLRPEDAVGVFSVYDSPLAKVIRPFQTVQSAPIDEDALADAVNRELEEVGDRVQAGAALLDALGLAKADAVARGLAEASMVIVSDGRTAVTPEVLQAVRDAAATKVTPVRIVGVGVGVARSFSDQALHELTTAGGGAYVYFDGSPGAEAFLADRIDELFTIAHHQVRLELSLPEGLELVSVEGGDVSPESVKDEAPVLGQALAAGGTMTFHQVLRWTGQAPVDSCAAIGWSVKSRTPAGIDDVLEIGVVSMGNAFAGVLDSIPRRQGSAVVAAATAFQGPTRGRLSGAVESLLSARAAMEATGASWQDHPLSRLCAAVSLACTRRSFDCGTCDATDQP